ncbi:MAG TPA: methyltransferase [Rhizomicrobium sp.]|jgi:tRNA1(Val) A37 N6-methylase TrmN6|nr:methyltransferase [Rhizomicrobium sp.]
MSGESFLGGKIIVSQPENGFRAGLDAVMLAAAVPEGRNALELGAGAGTASLCLAARLTGISVTGIEIDPVLVKLANENAAANGMAERMRFAAADVFALPLEFKREYDAVLMNPPFHGEGQSSADPSRARALMDQGALSSWLEAGLKRTVSGGSFTAILRADRLNEALVALPETGVVVYPLWPKAGEPARRVLVQFRKGGRTPFCLLPGLILHEASGAYTREADAVLRGEAALALIGPRL